jgi:hypothetical protein
MAKAVNLDDWFGRRPSPLCALGCTQVGLGEPCDQALDIEDLLFLQPA